MEEKFTVLNMTCSNCVRAVENAVKKVDGVRSASVSLIDKTLCVEGEFNKNEIISAVNKAGYKALVFNDKREIDEGKALKNRFVFSLIFLLPLLYFSMGNMLNFALLSVKINLIVSSVLAIVILFINNRFFISGIKAVINKSPNMDTLVSLGSGSAYIYSFVSMILILTGAITENSHVFFESSAMVLSLVTLGKFIEERSKQKTGNEIEKLLSLMPDTVSVIVDGKEKIVTIEEVKCGDILLFRQGDRIAVDGIITDGNASVDKSAITGESLPTELFVNDNVVSGSVITSGFVYVKANTVGKDTVFSRITEMVREAGASKAPAQKLADKISGIFVPIVCAIAVITFLCWIIFTGNLFFAFKYAICVLVVSCPCSLGLATPVAVMAGAGKGANFGVLFKSAEAMQNSAKISCVLFDKTATLTEGKPKVSGYVNYSGLPNDRILKTVSALEKNSNHPLKDALLDFCGESDFTVNKFEYVVGKGIIGEIDNERYYLGNFVSPPDNKDFNYKTVITLSDGKELICAFIIVDPIRDDSKDAIAYLKDNGIKCVMITGDNESIASSVAYSLNISDYMAEVMPEGKADAVKSFKEKGYFTAFAGDGINDSPALKTADVGISLSSGTDIAIDCSDIVVVGSVNKIADAIEIGKKTTSIIRQNLFWALFYNVILIPIASGVFAFFGFTLTPVIASICMCISSLFVVFNALRINNYKGQRINKGELKMKIKIEGMMCGHCVSRVEQAIAKIKGVESVSVSLKKKTAEIIGDTDLLEIKKEVENAGYKVVGEIKK